MKFLILIDKSIAGLEAEAKQACSKLTGHEIVWHGLDEDFPSDNWDGVLLTPGPTGIPPAVQDLLQGGKIFSVEVHPENTHGQSPDHSSNGTQAILLGAGVEGYRFALEALIAKGDGG